jgi:flagellar P-ring protein precursor FlgI
MKTYLVILILVLTAQPALAVKIADITRLDGQRTNTLTGIGLVFGLKGTGDGGDFSAAIKPLAAMLAKYANATEVGQLSNVKNVAVVMVTATVPGSGVRNGDKLDVYITSIGAASSLRGGRLFVVPLTGPVPGSGIWALAEGAVNIEDTAVPTVGVVKLGATMEADMPAHVIDKETGRFTLILDNPSASWPMAYAIAKIINEESDSGEMLATAVDEKNVIVTIPASERERPDSFISRVLRLPVPMLPTEARVTINEKTQTIVMTGDVEISPVVISQKGLTITTIVPAPVGTARAPISETRNTIALDTTKTGGNKLQDLIDAMEAMKVPAEDRITIVKQLYDTGKLHAKLYINGVNK